MRRKYIVFLLIIFSFINISASSGKIKQDSIIECNGKNYAMEADLYGDMIKMWFLSQRYRIKVVLPDDFVK